MGYTIFRHTHIYIWNNTVDCYVGAFLKCFGSPSHRGSQDQVMVIHDDWMMTGVFHHFRTPPYAYIVVRYSL